MSDKPANPWATGSKTTKEKVVEAKIERQEVKKTTTEKIQPIKALSSPTTSNMDSLIDFAGHKIDPNNFDGLMGILGFKSLREVAKRMKLHIAVHGLQKSGKTRFCMSAADFKGLKIEHEGRKVVIPGGSPVVVIGTEDGSRQLATQVPEEYLDKVFIREVYRENPDTFECDPLLSLQEVDKVLSGLRFMKKGTIVIDSFPDIVGWMNGVLRMKVLKIDPSERVQPSDYFWRNDKMVGMVRKLFSVENVHVMLTGQDEEVVRDAKLTPTGIFRPNWYKKVPYWVDFVIKIVKTESREGLSRWMEVEDTRFEPPEGFRPPPKIIPPTFEELVKTHSPAFGRKKKKAKK
jgi:hypothetical protein